MVKKNGWKITAIIFIILFLVETIFFVVIMKAGIDASKKEERCAYEICDKKEEAYSYDIYSSMCICSEDGIETRRKYIGG